MAMAPARVRALGERTANGKVLDMFGVKVQSGVLLFCLSVLSTPSPAQSKIPAGEARNHIGKAATVCGAVASTHYATQSRGTPTFLNFERAYPNQVFTVVIFGSDRAKFRNPELTYRNRSVCATGTIRSYNGTPEMTAYDPSQIALH